MTTDRRPRFTVYDDRGGDLFARWCDGPTLRWMFGTPRRSDPAMVSRAATLAHRVGYGAIAALWIDTAAGERVAEWVRYGVRTRPNATASPGWAPESIDTVINRIVVAWGPAWPRDVAVRARVAGRLLSAQAAARGAGVELMALGRRANRPAWNASLDAALPYERLARPTTPADVDILAAGIDLSAVDWAHHRPIRIRASQGIRWTVERSIDQPDAWRVMREVTGGQRTFIGDTRPDAAWWSAFETPLAYTEVSR